jgi:hypothetical protein
VPAQITAAGANAVLVAPQFAVNAADSSAGKFSEPNGFKHFLDEAAVKLARVYGDPRTAFTFATMPIVIVAYSGGSGAVSDRASAAWFFSMRSMAGLASSRIGSPRTGASAELSAARAGGSLKIGTNSVFKTSIFAVSFLILITSMKIKVQIATYCEH